jgi:hypothetical protein
LEECENLEEVEIFLQTRTPDGVTHKDANYIMAILDQRKKFVAHERFQYVLLKKFGESDAGVSQVTDLSFFKLPPYILEPTYVMILKIFSPGANPTITSYNASVVKIYNATKSLALF